MELNLQSDPRQSPRPADDPVLTIVGWLWRNHKGQSIYTPKHANAWARMIDKHLSLPHRFVLLTDQPEANYDPLIEPVPLWDDWRNLKNSYWGEQRPQCYPRLRAFSHEAEETLGRRFVSIDLDIVVIRDLAPLFDRDDDFLIIRRTPVNHVEQKSTYQGSMWMMTAGAREKVWTEFKGSESVELAHEYMGSDQAWIRYALGPDEKGWTEADGVYCFRNIQRSRRYFNKPPENARIVVFNSREKPWEFEARSRLLPRCAQCGAPYPADKFNGPWAAQNPAFHWVAKYYRAEC